MALRPGTEALLQSRRPCMHLLPREACHRPVSGVMLGKAPRSSGLRPAPLRPPAPAAASSSVPGLLPRAWASSASTEDLGQPQDWLLGVKGLGRIPSGFRLDASGEGEEVGLILGQ